MGRRFLYTWAAALIIHLFWMINVGYVLPYVPHFFLLPFLLFHRRMKTRNMLLAAFGTGLIVDAFSGTGGLYAAVLVSFAGLQKLYDYWTFDPLRNKAQEELNSGFLRWTIVFLVQIIVFELLFYFFDGLSVSFVFYRITHIIFHALETWLFLWLFTGLFLIKSANR